MQCTRPAWNWSAPTTMCIVHCALCSVHCAVCMCTFQIDDNDQICTHFFSPPAMYKALCIGDVEMKMWARREWKTVHLFYSMCIQCKTHLEFRARKWRASLESDTRVKHALADQNSESGSRLTILYFKWMQHGVCEKCIDFIIAANAERRSLNPHTCIIPIDNDDNGDDGDSIRMRTFYNI